jgi:hypothetical protein
VRERERIGIDFGGKVKLEDGLGWAGRDVLLRMAGRA